MKEKMTRAEAGRIGAVARIKKLGREGLSASAKKGAQTILARDPDFYSRIGKIGALNNKSREI